MDLLCGYYSLFTPISRLTPDCVRYYEHKDLLKAESEGRYPLPPQLAPPVVPQLTSGGYTNATVDDIVRDTAARQWAQMQDFFASVRAENPDKSWWPLWIAAAILGVIAGKAIFDRF